MSCWEDTDLDRCLSSMLAAQAPHGISHSQSMLTKYRASRDCIAEQILEHIGKRHPGLTSHSIEHARRVQHQAVKLLGLTHDCSANPNSVTPYELYVLALSIVIHDAAMAFGDRDKHEQRVHEVHKLCCNTTMLSLHERRIISEIVGAHTGKDDPIRTLQPTLNLDTEPIRIREIAAVLRLADECDEGPHRTTLFENQLGIPIESKIYHQYAKGCDIQVDRNNKRICVSNIFKIDSRRNPHKQDASISTLGSFRNLYKFANSRVLKLDSERSYAALNSLWLSPLALTDVVFMFMIDEEPRPELDIRMSLPPTRPKYTPTSLHRIDPRFEYSQVLKSIRGVLGKQR